MRPMGMTATETLDPETLDRESLAAELGAMGPTSDAWCAREAAGEALCLGVPVPAWLRLQLADPAGAEDTAAHALDLAGTTWHAHGDIDDVETQLRRCLAVEAVCAAFGALPDEHPARVALAATTRALMDALAF